MGDYHWPYAGPNSHVVIVALLVILESALADTTEGLDRVRRHIIIDFPEQLDQSEEHKASPSLSLKDRPREGRGSDQHSSSLAGALGRVSLRDLQGGPRGLAHIASVTFDDIDASPKDAPAKDSKPTERPNVKRNTTAVEGHEHSQPVYEKKHHRVKPGHEKSSKKAKSLKDDDTEFGASADISTKNQNLVSPEPLSKNFREQTQHTNGSANSPRDAKKTSVARSYGATLLNVSASEESLSEANTQEGAQLVRSPSESNGPIHPTGDLKVATHGGPTVHSTTRLSGVQHVRPNSGHSQPRSIHHPKANIQDFDSGRVPIPGSSAASQVGPMQGTRPTFGGSNYGNTAFFASPGYIRQGDVFPVRSPPAVRPISHGTSVQEPVYETFAANRGSLYVQRTPLLQNAAFPVEVQLGPEGYHQRSSTGSYGGVDPSYGSIFGQYAPNFGLLDHPDSADTALLGHQQNFVSPGQLYNNQPGKQEGDDYGQHFHLSGPLSLRNMNFIPAENEFSGLRGKQQYLSALSANADSGPFSGGGLRRTKGSYGINLGNYPLSYNEAAEHVSGDSLLFQGGNTAYIGQQGGAPLNGNFGGGVPEDAGQRAKYANAVYNRVAQSLDAAAYSGNGLGNPHQVATVGSAATGVTPVGQDRPISLLTHSGHFPVSPASRGETRPYAILPGGNFHTAQRSHSKSSPAPDAKYQQQSYQKPHCALASDAKLGNATFCTVDEQYPRESVVNSAFLDPLTARRLVPHIQDELHVFAESKDALAIDFTAQKGSTTNSHDIAHENNTQSSSEETKTRPELREACSAEVAMVRPLRAQNTRGEWKVIVNVDTPRNGQKYTQAVRVETCRNALRSCSYVPESLQKSVCSQKLTTYRLAAWSDEEGLHMDTFRFPVACLCLVVATG